MKKIGFVVAIATVLLSSQASAQLFNWSGFYYGVSVGYNKHGSKIWDDGGWFIGQTNRYNVEGIIFGLDGGQNWQSGNFVFGYEYDVNYSTASGSTNFIGTNDQVQMDARFLGTLRLRSGYAVDRTLFYITGGFAYSNAKTIVTQSPSWVWDKWSYGWVAGGGIEHALKDNPNWTVRLEALWVEFNRYNFEGGVASYPMRLDNSDLIVRIGLNYKR